jgi:hypothetical protein
MASAKFSVQLEQKSLCFRWFAEATKNSSRVTGVELIVEG